MNSTTNKKIFSNFNKKRRRKEQRTLLEKNNEEEELWGEEEEEAQQQKWTVHRGITTCYFTRSLDYQYKLYTSSLYKQEDNRQSISI